MARNTKPWYRNFPDDWLESERVQEMSLAAEGLYRRCIDYQTKSETIPADPAKLARVLRKDYTEVMQAWPEVKPHFLSTVNAEGEERLYNEKQRELLNEMDEKSRNYSAAQQKRKAEANLKQIRTKSKTSSPQNSALRASVSVSKSVSKSLDDFNTFWAAYPAFRKKDRKAAFESWKRHVTTPELAQSIIAHVQERAAKDPEWLKDGGQFVPLPTTFLNRSRWEDQYSTNALPADKRTSKFMTEGERRNSEMQQHTDPKSRKLTAEEQERAQREMEELFSGAD